MGRCVCVDRHLGTEHPRYSVGIQAAHCCEEFQDLPTQGFLDQVRLLGRRCEVHTVPHELEQVDHGREAGGQRAQRDRDDARQSVRVAPGRQIQLRRLRESRGRIAPQPVRFVLGFRLATGQLSGKDPHPAHHVVEHVSHRPPGARRGG
jgi:hypothetical protein